MERAWMNPLIHCPSGPSRLLFLNKKGKSNFFFSGGFWELWKKTKFHSTPTVGVHKVRRVERSTYTMLEKDAPQIGRSWSCWPLLVSTSIPHVCKHTETDGQGVCYIYWGGGNVNMITPTTNWLIILIFHSKMMIFVFELEFGGSTKPVRPSQAGTSPSTLSHLCIYAKQIIHV